MTNYLAHPIIYLRRLKTPPCITCANYSVQFFSPACTCAKYLERYNRLNCTNISSTLLENVRGTRFCEYEERESGERQDD